MMSIINDAISLKALIQPLYQISTLVKLECLRNGLRITAVDDDDLCRGRLTLEKGCFRKYVCREEFELTLYIDPLMNFFKTLGKSTPLYMSSNSDCFKLFSMENGWLNCLIIRREQNHEHFEMDLSSLHEAVACLQLNLEIFRNVVKSMSVFGDELVMAINKGKLNLSTHRLNHTYLLKPKKMNNWIIPADVNYRVAIPTHLLRIFFFVQSSTNYITIRVFPQGLIYLIVDEPNRFVQEFLISCRII